MTPAQATNRLRSPSPSLPPTTPKPPEPHISTNSTDMPIAHPILFLIHHPVQLTGLPFSISTIPSIHFTNPVQLTGLPFAFPPNQSSSQFSFRSLLPFSHQFHTRSILPLKSHRLPLRSRNDCTVSRFCFNPSPSVSVCSNRRLPLA